MIMIILTICLLALLIRASADIGSGVYLKTLCRGSDDSHSVALTFDDGPDETTLRILDILKENNARATFFLIGSKAVEYPATVRRIVEEGHTIGIHSYWHSPWFPLRSSRRIAGELKECEKALFEIVQKRPLLFRPPFGVTNPPIAKAVKKCGYQTVGWSIRSFDTMTSGSHEKILKKIGRKLRGGSIILLHDRLQDADTLLSALLVMIRQKGYDCVPVDELLKIKAYED